ncbi:unnamed protein product [Merluccius merluccius]
MSRRRRPPSASVALIYIPSLTVVSVNRAVFLAGLTRKRLLTAAQPTRLVAEAGQWPEISCHYSGGISLVICAVDRTSDRTFWRD